jgi:hypothetical protein
MPIKVDTVVAGQRGAQVLAAIEDVAWADAPLLIRGQASRPLRS